MTDDGDVPDRGASPPERHRRRRARFTKAHATAAVAALTACGFGYSYWLGTHPPEKKTEERLPAAIAPQVRYDEPPLVTPAPVPPRKQAEPATPTAPAPTAPPPAIQAAYPVPNMFNLKSALAQTSAPPSPRLARPYAVSFPAPERPDPPAPGGARGGQDAPGGAAGGIHYTASKLAAMRAAPMGDTTFMLRPQLLPCVTQTAINTTFDGMVDCAIPFDVKENNIVLLDAHSVIHGTYHGGMREGQERVRISADWIEDRATDCFVQLPPTEFTEQAGQSGVPASVDHRYLQRFGAGVTLSLTQSALSLAQAALSKGGNTYLNFNGGGGMESLANTILQHQIDEPPLGTIPLGVPIAAFITKPIDFSPCYGLALRERTNNARR